MKIEEIKDKNRLSETEFLKEYYPEDYDRPSVTADIVLFTIENIKKPKLKVFLIKRKNHPYIGNFAIPGCFVRMDESIDDAAERKIKEETGLDGIYMEQLYTFGNPGRDPRMRIVSSAYLGMIPEGKAAELKGHGKWFDIEIDESGMMKRMALTDQEGTCMLYDIEESYVGNGITGSIIQKTCLREASTEKLAFDHAQIISMAISRIAGKCEYTPILFNLMPETFTIPELQSVYELFLAKRPHNTLFRKRISDFITDTGMVSRSTNRPAKLYSFRGY